MHVADASHLTVAADSCDCSTVKACGCASRTAAPPSALLITPLLQLFAQLALAKEEEDPRRGSAACDVSESQVVGPPASARAGCRNSDSWAFRVTTSNSRSCNNNNNNNNSNNNNNAFQHIMGQVHAGHSRSCRREKESEKTTPFGVKSMRSQVLYRAAQVL